MTCTCGCCAGIAPASPLAARNRPGLARIETRIGTHGSILAGMLARLSSRDFAELAGLRTRASDDPAIALLDAWATVADVLTFYQEYIANEGYLRTATERRSLVELARLVGYAPRPGVAASVHLAFGLDKEPAETRIPKGTKVNSIPGPGETMEAFETAEEIVARPAWSALKPRQSQPQSGKGVLRAGAIWVKGVTANLKRGDSVVLKIAGERLLLKPLKAVEVDRERDRTELRFETVAKPKNDPAELFLDALKTSPTVAPANAASLRRDIAASFLANADALPRLAEMFKPALGGKFFPALRGIPAAPVEDVEVHAMRIEARPFGHNAPPMMVKPGNEGTLPTFGEWDIKRPFGGPNGHHQVEVHTPSTIFLDNDYPIASDSIVVIDRGDGKPLVFDPTGRDPPRRIQARSLNAYGLSGKTVRIDISAEEDKWLDAGATFAVVRDTRVFAGSEKLELADAPIADPVGGDEIELDGLYDGLESGRWLIVEGERADLFATAGEGIERLKGQRAAELVMLAGVSHKLRRDRPGDTYHTTLKLAGALPGGKTGLGYRYVRDSVTIHANVAKATHGETREEALGSGDAARAFQTFKLRLPPLTHLSAATPSGAESTLELRVDGVLWREAASLAALGPADRKYVTRLDAAGATVAVAGDGRHGRRLPSGRNNVAARYRQGIGPAGNVRARQISLLAARPLGVKDVVNPIPASGGAGPDGETTIRRNAPLAIMAMDRLVSLADYADFARAFAGVGKAAAQRALATRNSHTRATGAIEVAIAGVDDAPIDPTSDLYRNLGAALRRYGDPLVRIKLTPRARLALVVAAKILIDPDRRWDLVEHKLRSAMLERFSFDAAELGEPVFAADAIAALQRVPGVVAVDLDVFDALSSVPAGGLGETGIDVAGAQQRLGGKPGELAWLDGSVRDTLVLTEMKR